MQKNIRNTLLPVFLTVCILYWGIFFPCSRPLAAGENFIPGIDAEAAVLMEYSQGKIIYARNKEQPLPPASLTKIMTLLLTFEALQAGRIQWDSIVTVSNKASQTGGSRMFLEAGQAVAAGALITAIATISANDACVAIAEHLSGSEMHFVAEMNRKAQDLGLSATIFRNATGLPHPGQYSSALDMARLAHYYMQRFPQAMAIHSLQEYKFNGLLQHNRNPLLGRFPGADGLKTGHTDAAGYCLIATAKQNGMRFIAVLFNGSSEATRQRDGEILLNHAFRHYTRHSVFARGEALTVINITGGSERQLVLQAENALEVIIPLHRRADLVIRQNHPLSHAAPVARHTPMGNVHVYLDDVLLAETGLLAANDVQKAGLWTMMRHFLEDTIFRIRNRIIDWLNILFS